MNTQKKIIGIGLVGSGFMAKAHTNAYRTIPTVYADSPFTPVLVALASSSLERAQEAASRYGFARGVQGCEALLQDPEVDVIDICNGDALHAQTAIAALQNGKHVLCEKPLASNLADAYAMAEYAKSSAAKTMCGFNYRFIPAVALAKRLIESGKMGDVYSFHGSYLQDVGAYRDTPAEKLWYAGGPKASGVSYGIGCHIIDQARFLVGEIESVTGSMRNYNPLRDSKSGKTRVGSEEESIAVVEFENGAMGSIRASAIAAGRKNRLSWEISCSLGSLFFDLEEINNLWVFHKDAPLKEVSGFTKVNVTQLDLDHPYMDVWWPRGHGLGWEHAHINEIAHFLDCITANRSIAPPGASFEDGYRAIQVIEALRRSHETGRRILVNEIYPDAGC